jgi:hypothetical protein
MSYLCNTAFVSFVGRTLRSLRVSLANFAINDFFYRKGREVEDAKSAKEKRECGTVRVREHGISRLVYRPCLGAGLCNNGFVHFGSENARILSKATNALTSCGLVQCWLSGCARLFAEKFYFSGGRHLSTQEPASGDGTCRRRSLLQVVIERQIGEAELRRK